MDTPPLASESPPWRSSRVRRSPKAFEGEVILYKPRSTSPSEIEPSSPVEVRTTKRKRSKSRSPRLSTPKKKFRRNSAARHTPQDHSTIPFRPTPVATAFATPMDNIQNLGSSAQRAISIGSPSEKGSDSELEIMANGAVHASSRHTGMSTGPAELGTFLRTSSFIKFMMLTSGKDQMRLDDSQAADSKLPCAPLSGILNLSYGSDSSENEPDAMDPSYDLDWDGHLSDPVPGTGVYLGEFKSAKRPRDRNVVYAMLDQFDDVAIQVMGFNKTGRRVEDAVY